MDELYRARAVLVVAGQRVEGPWVEYGPTAVDGVGWAVRESAERLWVGLRASSQVVGEAELRSGDGVWPSEGTDAVPS